MLVGSHDYSFLGYLAFVFVFTHLFLYTCILPRYHTGEPLLPKIPHVSDSSSASSLVFGSSAEIMSLEEMNQFHEEYQRHCFTTHIDDSRLLFEKEMKFQALFVIQRICGEANKKCFLESLLFVANDLKEEEIIQDYELFINICLLIMEEMSEPEILPSHILDIGIATLINVSTFFTEVMEKPAGRTGREHVSYGNLLASTTFIGSLASVFETNPGMLSSITFEKYESIQFFLAENSNGLRISNLAELKKKFNLF